MAAGPAWINEKERDGECLHVAQEPARVIPIFPEAEQQKLLADPEKLFMEFYHKYYGLLKQQIRLYTNGFRNAGGFSNTCDQEEDILQEVFKKLWEKREQLHRITSPENYLFTLAKNEIISAARHATVKRNVWMQIASTEISYSNETEQDIYFRDARRILQKGIQQLPVRMKRALILKQEGYKINEIALFMGIRNMTVKNHLQAAVKKIKTITEFLSVRD